MSRGIGTEWNWVFFYRMVGIAVVEIKVTLFPDRLSYGPKPDQLDYTFHDDAV
jgi:hypothetical protein